MSTKLEGNLREYAAIKRKPGIVLPLVQEYLLARGDDDTRNPSCVHPSEMSKSDWCHRGTYFRIVRNHWPSDSRFNFILENIFEEGNAIHAKWQGWLAETGMLYGNWHCELCGDRFIGRVPGSLDGGSCVVTPPHLWKYDEVFLQSGIVSGREDGAVGSSLIEFKSVGIGTLRKDHPDLLKRYYLSTTTGRKLYDLDGVWKALNRPLKPHLLQAMVYLWLAREMGLSFDRASIVYEYKPNQQVKEYQIRLRMDLVQPLLDKVAEIEYALKTGVPPKCSFGGCKQCEGYDDEDTASGSALSGGRVREHRTRASEEQGIRPASEAAVRGAEAAPRSHRHARQ